MMFPSRQQWIDICHLAVDLRVVGHSLNGIIKSNIEVDL